MAGWMVEWIERWMNDKTTDLTRCFVWQTSSNYYYDYYILYYFLVGPLLFNELIDVTVISHTETDGGTDGGQIEKYLSNKRYKITWKAGLIRDARCRNLLLKWELLYIDRMLKSSIHIYYQWPRS